MSRENVDLARRSIVAWNERGVETLIENLDPEVEFHAPKESMNPGIYRGHDGVRDYFGRLAEIVEESRLESVEVIDVDEDHVIVVTHGFGKTANFDQEIEVNWALLITWKDGKGTHIRTFTDRGQAFEAAGIAAYSTLRESPARSTEEETGMSGQIITLELSHSEAEILLGIVSSERHNPDAQAVCDALRRQLDEKLAAPDSG